jgi:hypothetical protein
MSASPIAPAAGRFVVSAERWSGGWDLFIDGAGLSSGGGVTQVTSLDDADAQVRSYLQSVYQADFSTVEIDIALPGHPARSPESRWRASARPAPTG